MHCMFYFVTVCMSLFVKFLINVCVILISLDTSEVLVSTLQHSLNLVLLRVLAFHYLVIITR